MSILDDVAYLELDLGDKILTDWEYLFHCNIVIFYDLDAEKFKEDYKPVLVGTVGELEYYENPFQTRPGDYLVIQGKNLGLAEAGVPSLENLQRDLDYRAAHENL